MLVCYFALELQTAMQIDHFLTFEKQYVVINVAFEAACSCLVVCEFWQTVN